MPELRLVMAQIIAARRRSILLSDMRAYIYQEKSVATKRDATPSHR